MKVNSNYSIERLVKAFPILTSITFIFGYIGFHTFTSINNLPIVNTDISLIGSIGLLNITYFGIIYFVATKKRTPYTFESLTIYLVFNFVLSNPEFLSMILVLQMIFMAFELERKPKKIKFSDLRKRSYWIRKVLFWSEILIPIGLIIYSFLLDEDFFKLTLVIHTLLLLIHKHKKYGLIPNILKGLILILFPVITMSYFISSSNENILGLNKQEVEITTNADTLNTKIIFNDSDFFYVVTDSTNQLSVIRKSDVMNIKSKIKKTEKQGFLKSIRNIFNL